MNVHIVDCVVIRLDCVVNDRRETPVAAVRSVPRGVVMVDVAKRAGVSQKTVSRVVNNAPYVRPDVRDKVNAAIEELGYRPNVAARALARQRTHTIGMLVVGASLSGPARRLFSVDQAARRHGYTIALATVPDLDARSVGEGVESLLDRGVEGLVIEVPNHLAEFDLALLADCRWSPVGSDPRPAPAGGGGRGPGLFRPGGHAISPGTRAPDGLPHRRSARLGCGREAPARVADRAARRPERRCRASCTGTGAPGPATSWAASSPPDRT